MKKSFIVHLDSLNDIMPKLSIEQKGLLLDAMWKFHTGENIELDFGMDMAFSQFRNQFNRDNEKYVGIVERNRINGLKGGRPENPSGLQDNPNNPSGYNETQDNPNKPDSKSDSDSKSVSKSKKNTSEPSSVHGWIKFHFCKLYLEAKQTEYVWSAKDGAKVKSIESKLVSKIRKKAKIKS